MSIAVHSTQMQTRILYLRQRAGPYHMEAKNLLTHAILIRKPYEKQIQLSKNQFNIFSILRNENDEVMLHSKFIAELLNPCGSHNMGNIFLTLFCQMLGIDEGAFNASQVFFERSFGPERIDILIQNNESNSAIILENKIYAGDQNKQIERYFKVAKIDLSIPTENIYLIYLTLFGHEPSDYSRGNVESSQIINLSYETDILSWIEKCIEKSSRKPALRETLSQYGSLIKKLTNQEEIQDYIMELKKHLLNNPENLRLAKEIYQALDKSCSEILHKFWKGLHEKLQSEDNLIIGEQNDKQFCTLERIEKRFNGCHGTSYYGFNIDMGLVTTNGHHLVFRIQEDESKMLWGLNLFSYEKQECIGIDKNDLVVQNLINKLKNHPNWVFDNNNWWIDWQWAKPNLDIGRHSDAIIEMANPKKLASEVESYSKKAQSYISKIKKIIE